MIIHIVGNRPQFIKLAPLYHELEKRGYTQEILHSGQHYDANLSDLFFEELDIKCPFENLQVGSGTHAETTAKVMMGTERILLDNRPELVIVYGDTDTTLGASLAASKLGIPIAHVEGGTRTYSNNNPEEQNRIVTDHLATILFCSDNNSVECARKEGLMSKAHCTGDIMYDTFLQVQSKISTANQEDIVLMTWHRQENTCSKDRMLSIINFVSKLEGHIICPLHPRTEKCLKQFELWDSFTNLTNVDVIKPVGYVEMCNLMNRARLILTDSGGLSKESSFAGAKCLFMLDLNIWQDLLDCNWIQKVNPEDFDSVNVAIEFAKKAKRIMRKDCPKYYGDGHAAKKMVDLLQNCNMI